MNEQLHHNRAFGCLSVCLSVCSLPSSRSLVLVHGADVVVHRASITVRGTLDMFLLPLLVTTPEGFCTIAAAGKDQGVCQHCCHHSEAHPLGYTLELPQAYPSGECHQPVPFTGIPCSVCFTSYDSEVRLTHISCRGHSCLIAVTCHSGSSPFRLRFHSYHLLQQGPLPAV